jgi:hypothetical protein
MYEYNLAAKDDVIKTMAMAAMPKLISCAKTSGIVDKHPRTVKRP